MSLTRRRAGRAAVVAAVGTLLFALVGALGVVFTTKFGAGLSPDSVVYVTAARNLLQGRGFVELGGPDRWPPLVHFPPLYPALLALAGLGLVDPIHVARWLNALLFAANIGLVGLIIFEGTRGSWRAAAGGAFLAATAVDLLSVHSMAWSEPLFIFLGLLGLCLLARYARSPSPRRFVASATAIAAAALARYAAPPLILTGVLVVYAAGEGSRGVRARRAAGWLAISCAPMALWLVRNLLVAAQPTDRGLVFHPVSRGRLGQAVATVTGWLPPLKSFAPANPMPVAASLGACIFAALVLVYVPRLARIAPSPRTGRVAADPAPFLLGTFVVTYGVFLLISISFFDYSTPLDARMLSPGFACLICLAVILGHRLAAADRWTGKPVRALLLILGIVCAAAYLNQATVWVLTHRRDSRGYAAAMFRESATLLALRQTDPGRPIYSNAADAIFIISARPAQFLPTKTLSGQDKDNPAYRADLDRMRRRMAGEGALLVYLRPNGRAYLPSEDELKATLPLTLLAEYHDGAVYGLAPGAP